MNFDPDDLKVLHLPGEGRFEIQAAGQTAVLTYSLKDGSITFSHTGVPPALEERGIGSRLAKAGLEHAREKGYRVRPLCSFVEGYIQRHPEYQDLLD